MGIAALAIIAVFFVPAAFIILIVWFNSNEKRKRYQLQVELYAKALEKGQPIPDGLFVEPQKPKKKRYALNTGIICIATGIGVSLFFWMISAFVAQLDTNAAAVFISFTSVGIIPILIGIAFLIIHFIEKKQNKTEDAK